MGTTPNRAIPYVEPADAMNAYPAADKAQAERLDALLFDSGWVAVTVSAGFAAAAGAPPMVRRIGSVVYARGGWSSTGITTAAIYAVGSCPSGYRPSLDVIARAGTDKGTAAASLFVAPGGGISLRTNGTASALFYFGGQAWPID